ncbi:hypothetical protein GCM10009555_036830 [Acrocarpospora macrocephala]|uniref:Coproporphyrinogen III oxidase n=1 Tax=Acrocarpospora macrocephala TaxID=150177 RepID=A0A5M3WWD8_9ACTN|nr:protoporphyrinogen oxidase [Acrocarpospora macrocephala]GES13244.1 hypothetical protein Amac_068410 [Acrocarpospora macrocephala]
MGMDRHVVIVGAGIAGLAAAWFLRSAGGPRLRITVLEGASRIGGKLHASEVAGVLIDSGAESMLARRPEGKELVEAIGLGDQLVDPGTTRSLILSRGELRPMPAGQVMGVPSDLAALARSGILSPGGLARVPMDQVLPPTLVNDDISVAEYIKARMGDEIVDRLVEPLLGGVYAGRADHLSLAATMPAIAAAARTERSLLRAAKDIVAAAPKDAGPVFTTLRGGLGSLPAALAEASGAQIRTGVMVRGLSRTQTGWRLVTGPTREEAMIEADAVILAVPGPAASRLLSHDVPTAASELAQIEYASMAIVTLAYPRDAFSALPEGTGYLVPPIEGRAVKAVTFSTSKWPHLADSTANSTGSFPTRSDADSMGSFPTRSDADSTGSFAGRSASDSAGGFVAHSAPDHGVDSVTGTVAGSGSRSTAGDAAESAGVSPSGSGRSSAGARGSVAGFVPGTRRVSGSDLVLVRCSIGRIGEEHVLQRDDADLVALAMAELVETVGVRGRPVDSRVSRWGGGLPQYNVGHNERIARVRAAVDVHPGLAVCGAAYDGLGIPACVGTARRAASRILEHLDPGGEWPHDGRHPGNQPAAQGT